MTSQPLNGRPTPAVANDMESSRDERPDSLVPSTRPSRMRSFVIAVGAVFIGLLNCIGLAPGGLLTGWLVERGERLRRPMRTELALRRERMAPREDPD